MNGFKITDKIKRNMDIDILRCKNHTDKEGSESLYDELVAKYILIDPNFKSGLSEMGKAAVYGEEFDYRPELNSIASKLQMMIDLNYICNHHSLVKKKLDELIVEGYVIKEHEINNPQVSGLNFSYVSGEKYNKWSSEISLFNERYLNAYPLYEQIKKFNNSKRLEIFNKLIAILETVSDDTDFWSEFYKENSFQESESLLDVNCNKVFIVHGHDIAAKESVARFLEKIDMEVIILHEQADKGKTIIEKIEEYTDVAFAIVLYTPCDLGRAKNESKDKMRARQNVVFEHGYLIGKLGRNRVCALVKDNVETPGDISGVVYKKMDDNKAWMYEIYKEMKAAGIQIDANKLF